MESENQDWTNCLTHTNNDEFQENPSVDSKTFLQTQENHSSTLDPNVSLNVDHLHSTLLPNGADGRHDNTTNVEPMACESVEGDNSITRCNTNTLEVNGSNVKISVSEAPYSLAVSTVCKCSSKNDFVLYPHSTPQIPGDQLNHNDDHTACMLSATIRTTLVPSFDLPASGTPMPLAFQGTNHDHCVTCQGQSSTNTGDQNKVDKDLSKSLTSHSVCKEPGKKNHHSCCYTWRVKKKLRAYQITTVFLFYLIAVASFQFTQAKPKEDSKIDSVTKGRRKRDLALSVRDENMDLNSENNESSVETRIKRDNNSLPLQNKSLALVTEAIKSESPSHIASKANTTEHHDCADAAGHNLPKDYLPPHVAYNGGWLIHLMIGLYMFAAVASVCDIYFVPALEHICEDLGLQADVAGATFMAAASSAPEFCTSIIGVFFAKNDVGLGAIVGSSIFNLLIIIGLCAVFANMPVQLAWYPLTRDSIFYSISVAEMAIFMFDAKILWWEALIMVLTYGFYIMAMFFNSRMEPWSNAFVDNNCKKKPKTDEGETHYRNQLKRSSSIRLRMINQRRKSRIFPSARTSTLHLTKSAMRELHKMGISDEEAVHHLKIVEEEDERKKKEAEESKRLRRQSVLEGLPGAMVKFINSSGVDLEKSEQSNRESVSTTKEEEPVSVLTPDHDEKGTPDNERQSEHRVSIHFSDIPIESPQKTPSPEAPAESPPHFQQMLLETEPAEDKFEISEYENPLEMPDSKLGKCYFIIVFPVAFLHAYTIPDSRILGTWQAKCYMLSFVISVLYIAMYSYVMVWMISLAGIIWGLPETVTGLTFLAAGTSVPDCLASIFVARDGYGDMAVSNAIGSNVFDILLCLGVPWLIDSVINESHGYSINSKGMVYAVLTLGATICYLWFSMRLVRWTLTPSYGWFTVIVYLGVITLCILVELNVFFELNPCLY